MPASPAATASAYRFTKTKPMKSVDPLTVQFLNNNGAQGLQFYTNGGNPAKVKGNMSGFVNLDPNAQYRITNERGKNKVLYSGTGEEGLRNVYSIAQNLSATQKKKANWGVEMMDPTTGVWTRVADDDPSKNILGKIADIALPVAGALLAPLTGGASLLGTVGIGAAGAAAGSALSGAAQGRGIGDILKNAALAGGLSYAGGSLLQGLGGAGQGVSQAVGQTTGQTAAQTAAQAAGQTVWDAATGWVVPAATGLSQAAASGIGALAGAGIGAATSAPNGNSVYDPATDAYEVTGAPAPLPSALPALTVLPGVAGVGAAAAGGGGATPAPKSGFDVSKLPQYLQLASIGLGGLESLFGGGSGSGGNGVIPGGLGGNLNPLFSASLPTDAVIPGTGGLRGSQYGPRTMPAQDWDTYATRPEQSFFNHVPQPVLAQPTVPGAQAPAGVRLPVRRNPARLARGGSLPGSSDCAGGCDDTLAVMGRGGGRDDTVPALLSDGEYVVDAETVALLGDGSNKEGAKKLDDLRVSIRKHKGRKLSKGKFSDTAKQAEAYLSGARR